MSFPNAQWAHLSRPKQLQQFNAYFPSVQSFTARFEKNGKFSNDENVVGHGDDLCHVSFCSNFHRRA